MQETLIVEQTPRLLDEGDASKLVVADISKYPRQALNWSYGKQLSRIVIAFALSDALSCFVCVLASLGLFALFGANVQYFFTAAFFAAVSYCFCFWAADLYPGIGLHPARELKQNARAIFSGTAAMSIGLLIAAGPASPYLLALLVAVPFQFVLVSTGRMFTKSLLQRWGLGIPFFFLGDRIDIARAQRDMVRFGSTLLQPVGRFSDPSSEFREVDARDQAMIRALDDEVVYRGSIENVVEDARLMNVHWLIVVSDHAVRMIEDNPHLVMHFPEVVCTRAERTLVCSGNAIVSYGLASGVRMEESLILPSSQGLKRSTDLAIATTLMLLLSPLLALIAIAIKLSSRGPVLFGHKRIGKNGRLFHAWKFRSMVPDANKVLQEYLDSNPEKRAEWERDHKLKKDPRITWIGAIIRKTSLDELPQLWNVITGDMSLVGPRPIVEAEISKYGSTYREYLRVTPGITGLWQVSGRNNTTYDERLAYDEFYVRNWSPYLDFYILLRTVKTVLLCEGAY